jgi:threonine dehydrogenase-like Zn-dependent dehydrogenase
MKVAVLHAPGDLRLDEVPVPAIGRDDLLIRVASAGICGTDLHFRPKGEIDPEPDASEFHTGDILVVDGGRAVNSQ